MPIILTIHIPQCEGLPTGPCPVGANSRLVKNSQGDLFLCPSCDEARYPSTAKSKSSKNAKRASQKATTQSWHSAFDSNIKCTGCDKMCSSTACLKCDICFDTFDQQCPTLPKDVFSTLLTIVQISGWVCNSTDTQSVSTVRTFSDILNEITDPFIARQSVVLRERNGRLQLLQAAHIKPVFWLRKHQNLRTSNKTHALAVKVSDQTYVVFLQIDLASVCS